MQTETWDSRRVNDFTAIAGTMLVVTMIMLRGPTARGLEELLAVPSVIALLAYAVSIGRRDWPLFLGAIGVLLATALGWSLAQTLDGPWRMDWLALAGLLVAWAPWPTLHNRRALLVLWALAWAPLVMLLAGPPLGTLGWAESLITGQRLEGLTGYNEVGIPAATAVLSALALRLQRDTWLRYALVTVALVLVAAPGTRSMIPGVAVAGVIWFLYRDRVGRWRGFVVEALPWTLFVVVAARPAFVRTVAGLGEGLDTATSNRLDIWSQYWQHAQTTLLTGRGVGGSEAILATEMVETPYLPHNGLLTLVIDVGVPAMVVAVAGFSAYVLYRSSLIRGSVRWLLRVPLLVLLPSLFLLDHGLWKAFLTVPILLFSSAAPWVSESIERDSVGTASRQDSHDRLPDEEEVVTE